MRNLWLGFLLIFPLGGFAFAPTHDQCEVNAYYPTAARDSFVIEGQTYRLVIDLKNPRIASFHMDQKSLLAEGGIVPTLNDKPLSGPGRINIYNFGVSMYEVHVRDLKSEGVKADIELALYAYAQRVYLNLNVTPRGEVPQVELAWGGEILAPMALPKRAADPEVVTKSGYLAAVYDPVSSPKVKDLGNEGPKESGSFRTYERFPSRMDGQRSVWIGLFAGRTAEDLSNLVQWELHPEEVAFDLQGGSSEGYQAGKGYYLICTEYRGPRSFEEGWSNPNSRIEVEMKAALKPNQKLLRENTIICNVSNSYGTLEAAVMTDQFGFPLPRQVQVCKNFAGEFEEGEEEGDKPYGDSYVPLTLSPSQSFKGRVYHLFGNWGAHPMKQISSIRFFHHYFHASLGPTETFCYVPFEFPREDDRNYFLADVRGLSNFYWEGQPQHDHVSVVGLLRYKSGGRWINNLLKDTRIYLTAPNLASFALDYMSEDGKIKTTIEVFEIPQDDESRCFMKMTHEVLEPVDIDENSAHNLRFLNAGAYIVGTIWNQVAYTNAEGKTAILQVSADEKWILEGAPMGKEFPFCAAYPHRNGNMAFVVNRFAGVLGGKPVDSYGLSVFGGAKWTEMFLTAPGSIPRLEKGDRIEAHLFVMPYGHADEDYKPAERQKILYGSNIPKIKVMQGKEFPGFPRRLKADERGFAQFVLTGGDNWIPFLVEGFKSHKAPMLWEKRGGQWLFHDQQVHGNDWAQSYTAEDGSIGFVFLIKARPEQSHHFLVSLAPAATSITQKNGFVAIEGGPMDFFSPVKFKGLKNETVEDAEIFHCTGSQSKAVME